MKAKLIFAALLVGLLSIDSISQEDITLIDPTLTERPWLDNDVKSINGYNITQLFGEQPGKYRHMNFGPITSISYSSFNDLLNEIEEKGEKENWNEEEIKEKIRHYEEIAQGGALDIFISRYNESRANFKWFFVIIRNMEEKKISEIQLGYQAPEMPEGNGWWNYKRIYLDTYQGLPFFVYLNDKLSDHLSDFKFEVNSER